MAISDKCSDTHNLISSIISSNLDIFIISSFCKSTNFLKKIASLSPQIDSEKEN